MQQTKKFKMNGISLITEKMMLLKSEFNSESLESKQLILSNLNRRYVFQGVGAHCWFLYETPLNK